MKKNNKGQCNKYQIEKLIANSGVSNIYKVLDLEENIIYGLKEMKCECSGEIYINMFKNEISTLKQLNHPAIPKINEIIVESDEISFVMEYFEGVTLSELILHNGVQEEQTVVEWAIMLCDILIYLHSEKISIIYRDLKPDNVILTTEGSIKLIDFGTALKRKTYINNGDNDFGTRGYAAPEQFKPHEVEKQMDIYAMGMTLHHLVTGKDPRKKDYRFAPVRYWNSSISEEFELIICKCTMHEAIDRYSNFEILKAELMTLVV